MNEEEKKELHLGGEEEFEFPTEGGKVVVKLSDEVLTPFGGMVPFAAFLKNTGVLEQLVDSCPLIRTSPNASRTRDVVASFLITALCEGKRFSHVHRFREDPIIAQLFGLNKVVSDDTIRRFLRSVPQDQAQRWIEEVLRPLWGAIPDHFILDWDSTVLVRYGDQEGAMLGYNPEKRGRKSHHPLLAVVAGTRMCLGYRWRPGNAVSATEWKEAMESILETLGSRRPWLNRADMGFSSEEIMGWHENRIDAPKYLFKLKITSNVRRAFARLSEKDWHGPAREGVMQVAQTKVKLLGWSTERRVIMTRRALGSSQCLSSDPMLWREVAYEFEAYVTNLREDEASDWQIIDLYRKRADTENVFDELKNQWGFCGFSSRFKQVTELSALLMILTYNLWNLFLRLLKPEKHFEAISTRKWFLLIAARLVKSGRKRTLQIAVTQTWWDELKLGFQRLCDWIRSTAPQLKIQNQKIADFSGIKQKSEPFTPQYLHANCDF